MQAYLEENTVDVGIVRCFYRSEKSLQKPPVTGFGRKANSKPMTPRPSLCFSQSSS